MAVRYKHQNSCQTHEPNMPGQDRNTAALANLALSKVNISALGPASSNQKLLVAIEPLYAIQWTQSLPQRL